MSLRDAVVDELEAAGHDVPPSLQNTPHDDEPDYAERHRERWDGWSVTDDLEEGR